MSSEKDYGDAELAQRIQAVRFEKGLSMEAFAAVVGVSQPTQSRIERAKRIPDALYLRALRQHFGVDINALLMGHTGEAVPAPTQISVRGNHNAVAVGGGTALVHAYPAARPPRDAGRG